MVTAEEALSLVLAEARSFGIERVELLQSAGRVLAQDILADRNYPPFNRVTMDGIAINLKTYRAGIRKYKIEGVQAAGREQKQLLNTGNCIEVMTGAMLPLGTDTVIPYEACTITGGFATIKADEIKLFQNIHPEGIDSKQGDIIASKNTEISAAVIGLLASAGIDVVTVYALPKVAVCATGDELVEIDQQPLPHQIRQSNSYMLVAALHSGGIDAKQYHLPDEPVKMLEQLTSITGYYDVVLLSGAVSKGKFDYLPDVLKSLGLQTIFHGVSQRPGKPFLFGKLPTGVLIFGLPGNPVSTFVCYQLYFKAWLNRSISRPAKTSSAFLSRPFTFKPDLTLHLLVKISVDKGRLIAQPAETSTSGDLVTLARTEGILTLPKDRQAFGIDEAFELTVV